MLHLPANRKPLSDLDLQSFPHPFPPCYTKLERVSRVSAAPPIRARTQPLFLPKPDVLLLSGINYTTLAPLFHTSLTRPANRRPPAPRTNASKRSSLSLPLVSRPLRALALAACNPTSLSRRTT
jgi:hypothetical protein